MIADKLKELRARNHTQAEANDLCSLPTGTWQQYESGGREPSMDNARKIASAFGVSLDWLCNDLEVQSKVDSLSMVSIDTTQKIVDIILKEFSETGGTEIYSVWRGQNYICMFPGSQLTLMKDTIARINRRMKYAG